jgi:hypothetical protein
MEFLRPVVNHFTRETFPTVNWKYCYKNILWIEFLSTKNAKQNVCSSVLYPKARSPFWLLKPASEHEHARLLPRLSWSWTVLLPSDTYRNLLRPLQPLCFRLWPSYWHSLVPHWLKQSFRYISLIERNMGSFACPQNATHGSIGLQRGRPWKELKTKYLKQKLCEVAPATATVAVGLHSNLALIATNTDYVDTDWQRIQQLRKMPHQRRRELFPWVSQNLTVCDARGRCHPARSPTRSMWLLMDCG